MKLIKFLLVVFFVFIFNMHTIFAYDDSYFIEMPNGFLSTEPEDASKAISMVEQNEKMRASMRVIKVPFKVTRKSDGNYFMWSDITLLTYEGRIGYCIDPLTKYKTNVKYSSQSFDGVLNETQRNEISKIMYYGYTYPNHQSDGYYLATQKLIWEYLGYSVRYYAKNSDFTGNYDISNEVNEMMRLLDSHDQFVSFGNQYYELVVGDQLTLIDENGVLDDFSFDGIDGLEIEKLDNTLHIVATKPMDETNISLYKGDKKIDGESVLLHKSSGSQTFVSVVSGAIDPVSTSFSLRVQAVGDVVLQKVDSDSGVGLGGVCFRIAKDELFTEGVQELVTDDLGQIYIDDWPVGTYYYQEIETVDGYVMDDGVYSFEVLENQTTSVVCENTRQKVRLHIRKMAVNEEDFKASEASLDGAEYLLLAEDKVTVIERICAIEQVVVADTLLDVNTMYYVQEVVAPSGMNLNTELIPVYVEYDKYSKEIDTEVICYDEVIKNTITIQKYVNVYEEEIVQKENGSEFVFEIYNRENVKVDTLVTNHEGMAISTLLPYGTYTIKEQIKEGYIPLEPFDVQIISPTEEYYYEIVNDPIVYDFKVHKIDENNLPIEKVTYVLTNDQISIEKSTDSNGDIVFKNLLPGTYYLQEIIAPSKYVLDNKVYEIDLNEDKEITFTNYLKDIEILVHKVNEVNEPLANAKFVLKNDNYYEELETNEDGIASFVVHYGEYTLEELEAPSGYQVNNESYTICIDDSVDTIYEVVVVNKKVDIVNTATPQMAPWIVLWTAVISFIFLVYLRFYS